MDTNGTVITYFKNKIITSGQSLCLASGITGGVKMETDFCFNRSLNCFSSSILSNPVSTAS